MSIEKIELKMALRSLRQRELTGKRAIRAPSLALEHAPCLIVRIGHACERLHRHRHLRDEPSCRWEKFTDELCATVINLANAACTPRDAVTCLLVLKKQTRSLNNGSCGCIVPTVVPVALLKNPPMGRLYCGYTDVSWQGVDGRVNEVTVTASPQLIQHRDDNDVDSDYGGDTVYSDIRSMSEDDAHSEANSIDALSESALIDLFSEVDRADVWKCETAKL